MGNLNFAHNAGFSWYCLLLMFSGILMVVLGVVRNQRSSARRVLRMVLGVGYFGYGFYLTFIFSGGHYVLFFQAFLLPVLVLVDALRGSARRRVAAPRQAGP
jgi:hypothetical protein